MKALLLSSDYFEDIELLVPYYRLKEDGIPVEIGSDKGGKIIGKHGYEVTVVKMLPEIAAEDYDLLLLPGGKAPAALREHPSVLAIARAFMQSRRPVAAICHGPQILISAGVLKNRHATCYRAVAEEMKLAGAHYYEDREVVVDDNLVTSRQPADLPAFVREFMKLLKSGVSR
jgi:protease I